MHLQVSRRVLLGLLALGAASQLNAAERPNVLFIAVDDMRCDLGCYGASHVHSPRIDALAKSGVLFERAYVQQAVCNPSRVSVMTGLRPDAARVWDLVTDFRATIPDAVTIPQHFRRHGYRAVAFGKIFHNTFPDDVSWDEPTHHPKNVSGYSEENRRRLAAEKLRLRAAGLPQPRVDRLRGPVTEIQDVEDDRNFDGKQTTDALAKLNELSQGVEPFFLAVGYIRPHLPWITPRKYWELYARESIPLAENRFLPRDMPPVAFGDVSLGGFYELQDYLDYRLAPSPFRSSLSDDQQRELRHGYYASVSFIDAQVGRLLDGLTELGLDDDTIVVFWSDHGWKLGEHNGWCKQTNFEIDTHSPLIMRVPGVRGNGQSSRALVEFIDIYPTLCDAAGLPIPESLAGRSLVPWLQSPSASGPEAAYSQFPRKHEGRTYMGYAVRTDRHRHIEWIDLKTGELAARELYDHETDPQENVNIAGQKDQAESILRLSEVLWRGFQRPDAP